ncbi:glycerol-3-phosphate dehydrogenase/oxidase [bacterium]|nr:glycerol-3-phosphate dehydrogenase/oxidase [bacterium]
MKRNEMLSRLEDNSGQWDMIVIGGGATGVGVAIDAASRGYQVLLLEQSDFAKGTSSRSTKLIHGGVRYLQQGNISLVLEALEERGLLLQNAPHLVHNLLFIVPNYDWWEGPFYGIGLKVYDMLAGKRGFGTSKNLSKKKTIDHIPTVEREGLKGGVIYHDGQFDDSRLVVNMAQTAVDQGATLLNYFEVTRLCKRNDQVCGVIAVDKESGTEYEIDAKVVINATGVFSDSIRRMDDAQTPNLISPSQGVHIVLERSFLPGDSAIMVPHTDDGRVLFAIPWHNKVIVGTTDTAVKTAVLEPRPIEEELQFLLNHAARYLTKDPMRKDVLSAFAGLRPLIQAKEEANTAALSRDHSLTISRSGLVTIAGGKWTTYRRMAEDTVKQAAMIARLDEKECITKTLHIHGYHKNPEKFGDLALYGSDAPKIQDLIREKKDYAQRLSPKFPTLAGEVVWAARYEMARTLEDFLSRRTRALLLDAKASMEMAPAVADIMAKELDVGKRWKKQQLKDYQQLAEGYLVM